jgi:hypothetical protein
MTYFPNVTFMRGYSFDMFKFTHAVILKQKHDAKKLLLIKLITRRGMWGWGGGMGDGDGGEQGARGALINAIKKKNKSRPVGVKIPTRILPTTRLGALTINSSRGSIYPAEADPSRRSVPSGCRPG